MDIKAHILAKIQKQKQLKASEIIKETGFSRTYICRILNQLAEEGHIVVFGKANNTIYVSADKEAVMNAQSKILAYGRVFDNKNLNESDILHDIKKNSGIFLGLKKNIINALDYAFLEMLNNAIEHSRSKVIKIIMRRDDEGVSFDIADDGIGIFNNVKDTHHLPDVMTAIQTLIKGKETTLPDTHTGYGIFFTSKIADTLSIKSGNKLVIFNNIIDDVFIKDRSNFWGTWVYFYINLNSSKDTKTIFDKYSNPDTFMVDKTNVNVKLFKVGRDFVSRSEARQILMELEKFERVVLDFKDVETVGQGFADEIWRVWQNRFPNKKIEYINANENVEAMIKMAM